MISRRFSERRSACRTDTQYVVQLSGYIWALQQLSGDRLQVLDAACGTGFGTNSLSYRADTAVGVDIAPEAIAEARARYRAPNLYYLVMDVEKLGFPSAKFDAVISQDTIEHVPDDMSFVAEAARVLSPAGIFIVFTPYSEVHTTAPKNPYHLREYSPESLRSLLQPYFSTVRLFGRRPASSLHQVEVSLDEVRRYDPLRLRALVPRSLRHRLGSLWLLKRGAKTLDQISVEDIEYVEGVPPGSTTLIAMCQRGR